MARFEVYNLGAQSHVKVSFDVPEYTANVSGVGTLKILEAIRATSLLYKVRFYQALPRKCLVLFKRYHRQNIHRSIPDRLMVVLNFTLIG